MLGFQRSLNSPILSENIFTNWNMVMEVVDLLFDTHRVCISINGKKIEPMQNILGE